MTLMTGYMKIYALRWQIIQASQREVVRKRISGYFLYVICITDSLQAKLGLPTGSSMERLY